jgi:hypothetical protein
LRDECFGSIVLKIFSLGLGNALLAVTGRAIQALF